MDALFIGMILVIAVVLSLGMSCSRSSSLHNDNRFKRNYVYEPLTTMEYSEYKSAYGNGGVSGGAIAATTSGPTSGPTGTPTTIATYASTDVPTMAPTQVSETSVPTQAQEDNGKEGFMGLLSFSSPVDSEKPLDIYSQAKGSLNCPSYGYYNSKGPLCLDNNQMRLLQTRGGNASGRMDEIGH